jgi:lipid A 3-O-deacylase
MIGIMRIPFLKQVLGILLVAACMQAGAASVADLVSDYRRVSAQGKSTTMLEIENDTLLLRHDDGFYTSGLHIRQQYGAHDADHLSLAGWRIGQDLYTARDIKVAPENLSPSDHPYAGWLYGGFFKETHYADGKRSKFGFDIGCLGPCAGGEWTQKNLHRVIDQPLPLGWSTQLRNEWGVVLVGETAPVRWTVRPGVDLTPSLQGRFGNIFTDAAAGLTLRAGQLNLLPDQPTLHAFGRVDLRAVAYNATLQGGYFSSRNPHAVSPKRLVGEAEIGLVWQQEHYGLRASVVRRGNEISALTNASGAENFARLQFSYSP